MIRSVKVKLEITESKRRKLRAVYSRFVSMVNAYLRAFYKISSSLNKETKALVSPGHLSDRYRSLALQQALGMKSACLNKMKGKNHRIPVLKGSINLADGVALFSKAKNSKFNYWIRFSTLRKGKPLWVPFKSHKILNKYMNLGGKILSGLQLTKDCKYIILAIEIPEIPINKPTHKIGIDLGYNKLIACSDGKIYGKDIKRLCQKVTRRKNGSKGKRRAIIERNNYIGQACNQINWQDLDTIVIENLTRLKFGKKINRSKNFRRKLNAWTYPLVKQRLMEKAAMNRVQVAIVNPAFTSTTCPKCNKALRSNRSNELFNCRSCGYSGDSDLVASVNILNRYLGRIQSPSFTK